jgi:rhomboid family protein
MATARPNSLTKPAKAGSSVLPPGGTLALCLLTLFASVAQSVGDGERWNQALGVVPAHLWHFSMIANIAAGQVIPVWLTLLVYVFFHGGWWHVLPNMTALWLFGAIAEPVMGTRRFLLTYFSSGVVGALGVALVLPHSTKATTGASLAIAGLIGAYAALRRSNHRHHRYERFLVWALELSALLAVLSWLVLRTVPAGPDLTCSIMYHFIPFLAMWLFLRLVIGTSRLASAGRLSPLASSASPMPRS